MRVSDMNGGAQVAREGLDASEGERIGERREPCRRKALGDEGEVSVSTPSSVNSAGTRAFGLIARYSDLC
jgi:hypothetical protein